MILKVKHGELKSVKDVTLKDSELLDQEINVLLEQIAKLQTIWQGQDSDFFCNNVSDYVNKMKSIPVCYRNLGNFINDVNNRYSQHDEAFSRELETEVD